METKVERQSSVSDADQQPLAAGESEGVRVVAMCTFEAVQDYELGFRQYDVLTAIAKAEEIGGKIGLFPSECVEILKGYPDRLPLFKIFLSDDDTGGGIDALISNDEVPVYQKHISPSASTASLVSSSSSTEVDTTPRQRASTHPEPDVAVVSCYRCNAQVSIKNGQSFYPCECGANVKRPDVDDEHQHQVHDQETTAVNTKRRRCNTAGAAVGGVVREETPKQRKKREKLEREQKKKQDEEERKFRERRDKGRLSASQWNRQVDSARERLWRASVIMTGPNGDSTNDDGSASMLSTDDNISTVGSSAFDVDSFEDARSDSPRDISSFSSALSGRSLSRSGSLTNMPVNPESAKAKRDKKTTTKTTKEQRKKEKEEKKRLKKLEKEEREERRKMERMGREKKRRNSLFGSSSGSIATRKQRDKLTTTANSAAAADSVTVTINPITAHAKKQQQQMKAKTMVKTKSGKVMSLEEVEREGKKSNWDVSRLFSVRIGNSVGGGRVNKQAQKQRKASVGAADASHAQVIQRAAQQERELQEAARQLEEERRRFAEERQRFEQERLKVMLMLAQDMEGVKMARDGTPMYPSPANHPLLLVPTEPSPISSFAASQSSFTCLPSATATATLSADALVAPHESSSPSALPQATSASTEMHHHQSSGTSNSTPSLPSLYNPSLASMPSVAMPSAADDDVSPSSSADDVDVRESAEAVPASPRKPPSGGVFLPFLMAPRAGGPQQQRNATNVSVGAHHQKAESEAAAELEEKLLDQLKNAEDDDDSHVDKNAEEAESGTSSDDDDEEEDELTDEDSTSSEEEVRVQPAVDMLMREKRKITVAPIQGISDMKGLDADDDDADNHHHQQRQQLDGSWITAISPRRRERDQHQSKATAGVDTDGDKEMKDVIVRPGMSKASSSSSSSATSVVADKPEKKVSFAAGGASAWTSAESPRRMLEALRAQGASQAEIDRERKRLLAGNVAAADGTGGGRALTPAAAAIATKYEEEIDQLLEKMKQLRDRSSSDDSWGDTSSDSDLDDDDDDNADVDKEMKQKQKQKPHDISSDDDDEEVDEENDDGSEAEIVIPEWTRGPPKSLKEMKEYKDFVRARYEAEKRETERMLRRNQREMRARGMTLPSATTSHAPGHVDQRASWII